MLFGFGHTTEYDMGNDIPYLRQKVYCFLVFFSIFYIFIQVQTT